MCDGAFECNSGKAAAACVLINQSCYFLDGIAAKADAASALVSEALAMRYACLLGVDHGLVGISICSDCKEVSLLPLLTWSLSGKLKLSCKTSGSLAHPFGFIHLCS